MNNKARFYMFTGEGYTVASYMCAFTCGVTASRGIALHAVTFIVLTMVTFVLGAFQKSHALNIETE
jgi:hypothetical protein